MQRNLGMGIYTWKPKRPNLCAIKKVGGDIRHKIETKP